VFWQGPSTCVPFVVGLVEKEFRSLFFSISFVFFFSFFLGGVAVFFIGLVVVCGVFFFFFFFFVSFFFLTATEIPSPPSDCR